MLKLPRVWTKSNASKPYSYVALFRSLEDIQSQLILISGILLATAAGAPLPIIGVIFARIIDGFPLSEDDVQKRIYQLLSVAIAYFIVTWGWALSWSIVGARISRRLRTRMVDRALSLDLTFYETECPDITNRLTADAQAVQSGTAEKVGIFIQSVSYFIVAFIVGFTLNARLTGILFAAVITSMALVIYTGTSLLNRYSKEATAVTSNAMTVAEGAIKAVHVVQAFNAFDSLTSDHLKHLNAARKAGIKKALAAALLLGTVYFVAYAANALAFWEGSRILKTDPGVKGGAGTIYAIVFLILDASFVIGQAGPFIQTFALAASAGRRIFDVIDHPNVPIDVNSEDGVQATEANFKSGKEINLRELSFTYPARPQETVLNSINLSIKSGSTIGIVGASGSGKSTIATLLFRLYDPSSGSITIDGHKITEYNLRSLRRQITLVDQDPALFSGSIFSNIRYGYRGPPINDEEMRELCIRAAKAADAWPFITSLPQGLDTWLGEPSGTKLSGGQKQRVCLARALVWNSPLMILDEATSALDTISEASVISSLARARSSENLTTVVIAHRLSSVREADNIIVMGKGRILEEGNHDSLMSIENGEYRKLTETQKLEVRNTKRISEVEDVFIGDDLPVTKPESPNLTSTEDWKKLENLSTLTILRRCLALAKFGLPFTLLAFFGSVITGGHLGGFSGVMLGTTVSALVSIVGGAVLAHIVAWKIAIVLFATAPIVVLAGFLRLRVLAKLEERNQLAYVEAASLANEACTAIRTVAALGAERTMSKRFYNAVEKYREQNFRHILSANFLLAFALAITYFVYALAYWWGSKQVRSGEYSTLQFFIVLPAILFSAQASGQIFSLAPDIGRAMSAASRIFNLHDQKPTIDLAHATESDQSALISKSKDIHHGVLTFQNVSLTYQSRPDVPALRNVSFTVKSGETVALVGRSGAGKSSIISLLERFYDPTGGSVLLDGVDIRTIPVSQHRARLSLVPQEPSLFSGSVSFNVSLGAGSRASKEQVMAACDAVGIHQFISSLPDGYETPCGINGSQLSGGQKQRVAIARAYIRDPEILLLDEATSALDSQSEAQIQAAISAAARKRTTIMVAHRLTSVQKADRILVLDKGQIVEEGRHEDLMNRGGIYEQMVKAQSLG
ncbi:hypothetical protein B7463_g6468, partial [Scytalidium lignicola]